MTGRKEPVGVECVVPFGDCLSYIIAVIHVVSLFHCQSIKKWEEKNMDKICSSPSDQHGLTMPTEIKRASFVPIKNELKRDMRSLVNCKSKTPKLTLFY